METINKCPVCGSDKFKNYVSCIDYTVSRETFQVLQCEACEFRFTNPRPDESEIWKYYQAEEYISHSDTSKGLINKLYKMVRKYTISKKVELVNHFIHNKTNKNLLDIGCGTAEFLNACKENGWNVTGIEPSEVARKNAEQKYGITPLPQEKLAELGENKFNVITLWHVLEHIHQLEKTIEQINKLLLHDGVLVIAVPNSNAYDAKKYKEYWAAWDLPRHLYHFTKKDIEILFKKFGFRLMEIVPMKFDSFYISLVSEKYKFGKTNMASGFWNGLISNLSAHKNGYSSQIYIIKKTVK